MNKLALIGGTEIKKYSVAGKLWETISDVTGVDFCFEVIPIRTQREVNKFYKNFLLEKDFIGFNIACPWKGALSKKLTIKTLLSPEINSINTVYKVKAGVIGINTDIIGVDRSIKKELGNVIIKKILVVGAGGAGLPTAHYLAKKYKANVYTYDIRPIVHKSIAVKFLDSLSQLSNHKYDLIINATPLGKYYFGSKIKSFDSPLDINILSKVTHTRTVLQEMNYFPRDTMFLQIGKELGLTCIPGYLMLVFQAIGSFEKYFNSKITDNKTNRIINNIVDYIGHMEDNILSIKIK